jgi:2-oxoglutarate ferredoxin oxidoreductase subunit beta
MMVAVLKHKEGFALLDILQPCLSFNHENTFAWYNSRVRPIDESHDPYDKAAALKMALKWGDEIPIGILYRSRRATFEASQTVLAKQSLVEQYPVGNA